MKLFNEKKESPESPPPYSGTNGYSEDGYDDDMPVQCPPHTTERKLLLRIDAHVMPFLCIMYRK